MSTTTATSVPAAVGDLILVRLLAAGKRAPSLTDLCKQLGPFFDQAAGDGIWREQVGEALQALIEPGLMQKRPYKLTEEGQRRALAFLGLKERPARLDWGAVKKTYLVAKALGLPPPTAATLKAYSGDRLKALILKKHYGLQTDEFPTMRQALDALAWKQFGVTSTEPFSRTTVLRPLLDGERQYSANDLKTQLPTVALGATTSRPDHLCQAAVRRWLNVDTPSPAPVSLNLRGFAEAVREAAEASPTGRFGENKVFISHVWRKLQANRTFPGLDEAEFKRLLTQANHDGLLALSRADLVEAMDPADVHASETRYLNATFHFVQVERFFTDSSCGL